MTPDGRWITTTVLLERLRALDDVAWGQFARRFRGPIVNLSLRSGLSEDQAEDVAQSTLMAFLDRYRDGHYDRERGKLSSWLFGIASREIQVSRRRAARDNERSPGDKRTAFWAALPDKAESRHTWDADWKQARLRECMDRVRGEVEPTSFEAFEMVTIRRQEPAQVAEALGITRNAVFIAKHRVIKRLREAQQEFDAMT